MGSAVMSLCKSRALRQTVYLSISLSPAKMKVQTIPSPLGRMSLGAKWAMEKRHCNQTSFYLDHRLSPGQAEGRERFLHSRH